MTDLTRPMKLNLVLSAGNKQSWSHHKMLWCNMKLIYGKHVGVDEKDCLNI